MSHHLVSVSNLEYCYPDGTQALRGVSFTLRHGEAVAIIGANGAGKSTLLSHFTGNLLPSAGEIRIGDDPVLPSTLARIRRTVGMVFQNADDQLFMPTVFEDVAFGPANSGLPRDEVEKRVVSALSAVGAVHLRERSSWHLSAGEKRVVSMATVLAMSPDVLVMDEPTAGLDPRGRRRCIELIRAFEHTRIIATHDLDLVLETCPRTILLHEGRIMADGPSVELLRNRQLLENCCLELPICLQIYLLCSNEE